MKNELLLRGVKLDDGRFVIKSGEGEIIGYMGGGSDGSTPICDQTITIVHYLDDDTFTIHSSGNLTVSQIYNYIFEECDNETYRLPRFQLGDVSEEGIFALNHFYDGTPGSVNLSVVEGKINQSDSDFVRIDFKYLDGEYSAPIMIALWSNGSITVMGD